MIIVLLNLSILVSTFEVRFCHRRWFDCSL